MAQVFLRSRLLGLNVGGRRDKSPEYWTDQGTSFEDHLMLKELGVALPHSVECDKCLMLITHLLIILGAGW